MLPGQLSSVQVNTREQDSENRNESGEWGAFPRGMGAARLHASGQRLLWNPVAEELKQRAIFPLSEGPAGRLLERF